MEEWLVLCVLGYTGGIVAHLISPHRRGPIGFLSSSVIGSFCGSVMGMTLREFEVHLGLQYLGTACSGLMGNQILSGLLRKNKELADNVTYNITNHGDGNQVNQGGSVDGELKND